MSGQHSLVNIRVEHKRYWVIPSLEAIFNAASFGVSLVIELGVQGIWEKPWHFCAYGLHFHFKIILARLMAVYQMKIDHLQESPPA